MYFNAYLDYRSAAIYADDKSQKGSLYYNSALNKELYDLESGANSCQFSKNEFKKACDLGNSNACKDSCLK